MRLIDADEFIKKLDHSPLIQDAMRKAFDHMLTIEPQPEQRWIPTSEKLPEPDVDVLLQLSDMMATGYYFYDGWHVYFSAQRKDVIAWMPLPEPYAERRQDEARVNDRSQSKHN